MKKPYVAIVDDDSAFAAYLRTFLSLRGYEARCYTRGDETVGVDEAVRATRRHSSGRDDARARRPGDASGAESVASRSSGHHAVGPEPGLDHRRGGQARSRRLRRQAGRPGGARRNRSGRRDQERDREDTARLRAQRAEAAAERRRGPLRLGQLGQNARDCPGHRAGRRQRRDGAHPRRKRSRQGARRARDSTSARRAGTARSSRSIARPCRRSCSRASCSATNGARSPGRRRHASASSSWRTAGR